MIRVLVESPFAGDTAANIAYLHECLRDCLTRGESPYASHLLFTQFLDDNVPEERELGIKAGLVWGEAAQQTIVYTDLGISRGMEYGIAAAERAGRPVTFRSIR